MELSEAINKVRLELCLFQEGLARELHVGFTSVNRWENNHAMPNPIARHKSISPELIDFLMKTK